MRTTDTEGIQAEAKVRAVDPLANLPNVLPGVPEGQFTAVPGDGE